MSEITEDDLLDAIRMSLPDDIKPGEFTVERWREHFGLTRAKADYQVKMLVEGGVIERVPTKRVTQGGKLAWVYRKI